MSTYDVPHFPEFRAAWKKSLRHKSDHSLRLSDLSGQWQHNKQPESGASWIVYMGGSFHETDCMLEHRGFLVLPQCWYLSRSGASMTPNKGCRWPSPSTAAFHSTISKGLGQYGIKAMLLHAEAQQHPKHQLPVGAL